ncbi:MULTISPECIES: Na+/H+ antiporter NhaC family protein [unclassified Psychrobacillus]|uniref:Na+/H+ antiporter family protein n=1 Tax=unclassified Psychrobacillus TaxID=2636677 RepID=UPI00146F0C76|nr:MULTISPECIES: Na+/H+ antiporter NhaC family protein [unclassified Psychrobacillus]MCM3358536.1 TRAP transporter large permease subunit [Psychrobacillus sp. MER TA 171]NME05631.1 TRAP transporter large permease subunit [Psychrobacillus sp. BL-248-WT-3]
MNAVLMAVTVMLVLSLLRINVVFSLIIGALVGGLTAGLSVAETIEAFTGGLGAGATIALSYGLLGGFAVAISKTGIPELLVAAILKLVRREGDSQKTGLAKTLIFLLLLMMAIFSQNLIPIHIAFIPLLVPPILKVLNMLQIDRRLIATILAFGLITPYMLLPYGFGAIYQEIVATQMGLSGLAINLNDIPQAMVIPALGMVAGLVMAFVLYRKPRQYKQQEVDVEELQLNVKVSSVIFTIISLIAALYVQIATDSMIAGALAGITVLYITGALKWKEADLLLTEGMRMMAFVGFVMITANGFAAVISSTGHIESLVETSAQLLEGNVSLAVLIMLVIGLIVTLGIGSSFATIPIIAAIFVPLALELGLSPLATIALIGTAGALGDAGSPASDSTLGPTAGLNVDGQHNHIWDTVVPTFICYNIPLIIFSWFGIVYIL